MKLLQTNNAEIIDNWWTTDLIKEIEEIKDNEISLAWFSRGGAVLAGWNFADFLNQSDKKITARVTGMAASMGAALLPFFDKAIGAKQSWVMIHAPAGGSGKVLDEVRGQLKDALNAKVDDDKFKAITGVTISEAMNQSGDDRVDYWLTGQQAYDIGLYDELFDITPKDTENIAFDEITNSFGYDIPEHVKESISNLIPTVEGSSADDNKLNIQKMDLTKLKAEHPEVYTAAFNEGQTAGITAGVKQENERTGAYLVFADVDKENVLAGIKSGEAMNETQRNEFLRKSAEAKAGKGLEEGSPEDLNTGAAEVDALDAYLEAKGIN